MRQVTVSLNEDLIEKIDEVAAANDRSRSNLVHLILQKWAIELETT